MIDARAVFDAVAAPDPKSTTDKLMLIHVLKLKELLALKVVSRMIWLDTRDMLADGLNKGVISRDAIRLACISGIWTVTQEFKIHSEVSNLT